MSMTQHILDVNVNVETRRWDVETTQHSALYFRDDSAHLDDVTFWTTSLSVQNNFLRQKCQKCRCRCWDVDVETLRRISTLLRRWLRRWLSTFWMTSLSVQDNFSASASKMSHWICQILDVTYQQIFWCSNMAKDSTRPIRSFPAR